MSPGVGHVREDAEVRPRTDDPVQLLDGPALLRLRDMLDRVARDGSVEALIAERELADIGQAAEIRRPQLRIGFHQSGR